MARHKHFFWVFANLYGYFFGWSMFSSLHKLFLTLSLHGLGYDNPKFTGEEWFIKNYLRQRDIQTCLDVGAHVGVYTALLLDTLPQATIHSIEPSSSSFKELKERHGDNPRVKLHNIAISDKNGQDNFYSKEKASEKASLSASRGDIKEVVETRRLDTFMVENNISRVDFIKVDTEGYEREVLGGLIVLPSIIQFEFNIDHLQRGVTLLSITELLPGYTFYRLLPHGMISINPNKFVDNIFMFSNIVALRK